MGPTCRRCRADLSLLFTIDEQRQHHLAAARDALRNGEWAQALEQCREADALRSDDETRMLSAAVHLLSGDYPAAWSAYATTEHHV
jgi:hypothetical protein